MEECKQTQSQNYTLSNDLWNLDKIRQGKEQGNHSIHCNPNKGVGIVELHIGKQQEYEANNPVNDLR